jgi:hypothetical protein
MDWLNVTQKQKKNIESLFEKLRAEIEEAQMHEPKKSDEQIPMQYGLWMVADVVGTGPLPALRPIRKRN